MEARVLKGGFLVCVLFGFLCCHQTAYQIRKERIDLGISRNFRGLSISAGNVVWVGGSRGSFLYSSDKGNTWKVDSIDDFGSLDFRSSIAIDKDRAILLSFWFSCCHVRNF